MITALTWGIVAGSAVLMALAGWYAWRDHLLNDAMLGLLVLVEIAVIVQAGRGLVSLGKIADTDERATFAAYLITLPFVPLGTGFLALKEKTRWAMGAIAVGAFAVVVMSIRCQQIWDLHA